MKTARGDQAIFFCVHLWADARRDESFDFVVVEAFSGLISSSTFYVFALFLWKHQILSFSRFASQKYVTDVLSSHVFSEMSTGASRGKKKPALVKKWAILCRYFRFAIGWQPARPTFQITWRERDQFWQNSTHGLNHHFHMQPGIFTASFAGVACSPWV